ncbi:SufS family cysteine desulfurase [Candidatus Micrarchaeota archaeon]|nr:SufS family cysteine desulfurase [Candidatus Micrarchaeota archaeon]
MLNTNEIRKDFPILQRKVNGHPLTYLDNGATSQKPAQVINAISDYYSNHNANVHRGVHTLSAEVTEMYEGARKKVAKFINAEPEEIIFTKNASEALNLVAYTYGDAFITSGDSIATSIMEHHSDFIPWQVLAKKKNATLSIMNANSEGEIPESEYSKIEGAKLTSIVHASNVLGTINPLKEFAKISHENNGVILVDGSQSAPHLPVDVKDLDCDFFAFTGHKMLGPTGIGILYGKKELLEKMPPFLYGGDMVVDAKVDGCKWNDIPYKFEAGTPNMAGAIGLGASIDYLTNLGMENVRAHEVELLEHATKALLEIDELEIYGPKDPGKRTGVLSFNIKGLSSIDLSSLLDEYGFAIRSGFHCAQPLHDALGINPSARISFYIYNTKEEITLLKRRIEEVKKVMS